MESQKLFYVNSDAGKYGRMKIFVVEPKIRYVIIFISL